MKRQVVFSALSKVSLCLLAQLYCVVVANPAVSQESDAVGFKNFITTDGPHLMDGDKKFRFLSFNVPTLLYVEDEMDFEQTNPYALPTEFELRDLYESVNQMGGRVVRAYCIPVRNASFPAEAVTYVEAPGKFNEDAFKAMDLALALAREYKIRVVIPILNNWQWMGGRPNYAAFRGKGEDEFWTDPQLIEDFKLTVEHVLTRVNTINGIPYKDDPTILAWETGNELQSPPEWTIDICRYIKSLDSNHLVIDGYHALHHEGHADFVKQYSINEDSIDLINTHHYERSGAETVANLKKTLEIVGGKKPIFVGEFGFIGTPGMECILDYLKREERIPGALIWSLRRHDKDGGFYHHTEPFGRGLYRAYHWPGFDSGERYDERKLLDQVRRAAFAFQGVEPPAIKVPAPPELIKFESVPKFSWRGSAGAGGYDIESAPDPAGPWKRLAFDREDLNTPGFAMFSDEMADVGKPACYRIRARNVAGVSEPSNVVKLDKVEYLTRIDDMRNVMGLNRYGSVEIQTDRQRSFKEAYSRLHGEKKSHLSYLVPGKLLEMRVYSFEKTEDPMLHFSGTETAEATSVIAGEEYLDDTSVEEAAKDKKLASDDGQMAIVEPEGFEAMKVDTKIFASSETNYDYLIPTQYTFKPSGKDLKHIKILFKGTADIVRVEMDYLPE